ncbi:MAG: tetratricopeptide repeat protein [Bacteroidia bacterium]|nr:tetratricopeptide repeat protein [Bacteroidia bacterium]
MKKKIKTLISFFVCGIICCNINSQDLNSAILLTRSEQFDAASSMFKRLIKADPKKGDNYFYYGINWLKSYYVDTATVSLKEVTDSAKMLFTKGIAAETGNTLNYIGLGRVFLINNDTTNAEIQFKKAKSLLPSKSNRNSVLTKSQQALVHLNIGESYLFANPKNVSAAISYLKKAEQLDPANPDIYIALGDAYLELNDGSNAIANYKKAQELAPKSSLAKMKIGSIYVRSRNFKAAIPFFEEAVQIDSNFAPVYRELGELYYRAGFYEKAQKCYKKLVELSPGNISAKIRYASFLFLTKDFTGALSQIEEILKMDTSSVILHRLAAYSYFETKEYDKALTHIEKFVKRALAEQIINSDYVYHGRILANLGKDSIAILKLNEAYLKDTTNYDILSDMAASYTKLKKHDEAAKLYEKKISAEKAAITDYYNLGKSYYNLQQWEKADTMFGYFISKQPNSMQGYSYRAITRCQLDPETETGLAKPVYEKIIEKAMADTAKYAKQRIEAYSYMGYYFLKKKDYVSSKPYYLKVIALDPENEKAKTALNSKELKAIKP